MLKTVMKNIVGKSVGHVLNVMISEDVYISFLQGFPVGKKNYLFVIILVSIVQDLLSSELDGAV